MVGEGVEMRGGRERGGVQKWGSEAGGQRGRGWAEGEDTEGVGQLQFQFITGQ